MKRILVALAILATIFAGCHPAEAGKGGGFGWHLPPAATATPTASPTPSPSPSPSPSPTPTATPTASPTPAVPTVVHQTSASFCQSVGTVSSVTCSLGFTPAIGSVLYVNGGGYSGSTCSLSATGYTLLNNLTANGGCAFHAYQVLTSSPPTSITLSVTPNAAIAIGAVYEIANANTTTPIDTNGISGSFTSTTTCGPGAVTPNQANDLLAMFSMNLNGTTHASSSTSPSTTLTQTNSVNSSYGLDAYSAFSLYTGTTGITPTWTWSAGQNNGCVYALINPVGSSPPPAPSSGAKCLTTTNGQQWSTGCLPYTSTGIWNSTLPDTLTHFSALPAGFFSGVSTIDRQWVGPSNASSDGSLPIYFTNSSMTALTLVCQGINGGVCGTGLPGSLFMPSNAMASQSPDHHIGGVDSTTGNEVDCWHGVISGGTLTCWGATPTSFITGTGVIPNGSSTTSGVALGTPVRAIELQNAIACAVAGTVSCLDVKHAIPAGLTCVVGTPVSPFTQGSICTTNASEAVPMGTRIVYNQTCATLLAQYQATTISAYQAVMLCTAHLHGVFVMDTGGNTGGGGWNINGDERSWESSDPYIANGNASPWTALILAQPSGVYNSGNGTMNINTYEINTSNWIIADPCYQNGTC